MSRQLALADRPKTNGVFLTNKERKLIDFHLKKKYARDEFGSAVRPFENPKFPKFQEERKRRIAGSQDRETFHPHQWVIDHFTIPDDRLVPPQTRFTIDMIKSCPVGRFTWVDTPASLQKMIDHLSAQREISFDIESNMSRTYHGEPPVLFQFSSFSSNYLVDVLTLWDRIPQLKSVLESPSIYKIMWGCANDLKACQLFFDIYPQGIIDAERIEQLVRRDTNISSYASDKLKKSGNPMNLATFVNTFIPGANMPEQDPRSLGDFTQRPLPRPLLEYALDDAKLLLYAWHNFKELAQRCEEMTKRSMATSMKVLMSRTPGYPKPPSVYKAMGQDIGPENWKRSLFHEIYNLRDRIARQRDVHPTMVMRDATMNKIVRDLQVPQVLGVVEDRIHYFSRENRMELEEILARTRVAHLPRSKSPPRCVTPDITRTILVESVSPLRPESPVASGPCSKPSKGNGAARPTSLDEELVLSEKLIQSLDDMEVEEEDWDKLYPSHGVPSHVGSPTQHVSPMEVGEPTSSSREAVAEPEPSSSFVQDVAMVPLVIQLETCELEDESPQDVELVLRATPKELYSLAVKDVCLRCYETTQSHFSATCPKKGNLYNKVCKLARDKFFDLHEEVRYYHQLRSRKRAVRRFGEEGALKKGKYSRRGRCPLGPD